MSNPMDQFDKCNSMLDRLMGEMNGAPTVNKLIDNVSGYISHSMAVPRGPTVDEGVLQRHEQRIERIIAAFERRMNSEPRRGYATGGAVMAHNDNALEDAIHAQTESVSQSLAKLAGAFERLADSHNKPRTIVRDEKGRPVGVKMEEYRPPEPEFKIKIIG